MPKFCRKPQVVEAFQWDGCVDNTLGLPDWMVEAVRTRTARLTKSDDYGPEIILNNYFGTFIARPGDWIVMDEDGHINRCHADMFQKVYAPDERRQDDRAPNNKRLLELLEHAVKVADEWYDDGYGGRIEGDALIDEARALVSSGTADTDTAESGNIQKISDTESAAVVDYWLRFYFEDHCTICGNHGWIDTRGAITPAGVEVGRVNYCICPNGQALRALGAKMPDCLGAGGNVEDTQDQK